MQKAAKHILLITAALALAASAGASDLFNNTNGGGVLNRAPNPAFFTLIAPAHVTQLVTYHWNNGRGAFPGAISLRYQNGQIFGPFPARGYQGQGGAPNVSWVADVNIAIPPGAYIVLDSDPNTWSYNPQSGYRGFAIVRGALLPPQPRVQPPAPRPAPAPMPAGGPAAGFHPCAPSTYSVAFAGPCVVAAGSGTVTVEMRRSLPNPPAMLLFKRVISNGVIAQYSSNLRGSGQFLTSSLPAQLCIAGTSSVWDIYLLDSTNKQWGEIGQVDIDCRAYGR